MKKLGWGVAFVLGVILMGIGVPLAWLWLASQLQHGLVGLEYVPLAVMVFGMLGTYLAITFIATGFDSRRRSTPARAPTAWNRSLSSERKRVSAATPVETMFITATVFVGILFEIWLFTFAGSSVPSGTG